jgi:hypothetical protein
MARHPGWAHSVFSLFLLFLSLMYVCFGALIFLSIVEGGLVWAPTPVQLLCPISLDIAVEALEKLQTACSGGPYP